MVNAFGLWRSLLEETIEGRYFLQEVLGTGGFGCVFRADWVEGNRRRGQLAIKLIPVPDDRNEAERRFQELELAFHLNHPHVIRHYQPGQCVLRGMEFFFLPMELGTESLQARIGHRCLSDRELQELCLHLASALDYLHNPTPEIQRYLQGRNLGKAIVHRDIKPANILRVGDVWKICDLGIARTVSSSASHTARPMHTLAFAPPESFDGIVSPASDLWALGITLAVARTNNFPYPTWQTDAQLMDCIRQGRLQLPEVSEPIRTVMQQCLVLRHKQRWTTQQVLAALQERKQAGSVAAAGSGKTYIEVLGKGVELELVRVPAGRFLMGAPQSEEGSYDDERPQHWVDVPEFFMGKYPVTQAQYEAVMGQNPSHFKGAKRPVEQVSWHDAQAFCAKLSQMTGKRYRLPSEAEWEYACRAGTTTPFYFGKTITADQVNYDGNYPYGNAPKGQYRQETTNVGSFPPNGFGLYDMHGNVWECCEDVWHNSYNGAPADGSAWVAGGDSDRRVARGGSWYGNAVNCRSACRSGNCSDYRSGRTGFRVVLSSS